MTVAYNTETYIFGDYSFTFEQTAEAVTILRRLRDAKTREGEEAIPWEDLPKEPVLQEAHQRLCVGMDRFFKALESRHQFKIQGPRG